MCPPDTFDRTGAAVNNCIQSNMIAFYAYISNAIVGEAETATAQEKTNIRHLLFRANMIEI
jgi:hypothetical protein